MVVKVRVVKAPVPVKRKRTEAVIGIAVVASAISSKDSIVSSARQHDPDLTETLAHQGALYRLMLGLGPCESCFEETDAAALEA